MYKRLNECLKKWILTGKSMGFWAAHSMLTLIRANHDNSEHEHSMSLNSETRLWHSEPIIQIMQSILHMGKFLYPIDISFLWMSSSTDHYRTWVVIIRTSDSSGYLYFSCWFLHSSTHYAKDTMIFPCLQLLPSSDEAYGGWLEEESYGMECDLFSGLSWQ